MPSGITTDQAAVALWGDRYRIPWGEPACRRRMLDAHLSQDGDPASSKLATIDRHVRCLHETLLERQPARILDLGCGPGLYATRLASFGHAVRTFALSPASIEYAIKHNEHPNRCEFALGDLRTISLCDDYGLAVMIYGEFNAFRSDEIGQLLAVVCRELKPGGRFPATAHTFDAIEAVGTGLLV